MTRYNAAVQQLRVGYFHNIQRNEKHMYKISSVALVAALDVAAKKLFLYRTETCPGPVFDVLRDVIGIELAYANDPRLTRAHN